MLYSIGMATTRQDILTQVNNVVGSKGTKEETIQVYNKWGDAYDQVSLWIGYL